MSHRLLSQSVSHLNSLPISVRFPSQSASHLSPLPISLTLIFSTNQPANRAADRAADRTADRTADRAADRTAVDPTTAAAASHDRGHRP